MLLESACAFAEIRVLSAAASASILFTSACASAFTFATSACACAVCDRDTVVATGGIKGEGKPLTAAAEKAMEQRKALSGGECGFALWEEGPQVQSMLPVIAGGDLSGCVVLLDGKKSPGEGEVRLARMAAGFLSRQMEN